MVIVRNNRNMATLYVCIVSLVIFVKKITVWSLISAYFIGEYVAVYIFFQIMK